MASIWFTLSIILCIISEIITVPLAKARKEEDYTGLNEQAAQRLQTGRIRRAAYAIPPDCASGNRYYFKSAPHCHVTNAEYDPDMKLCLEKIVHVPGMPDGNKGYIYIAYKHYLYKTYQATQTLKFFKCPIPLSTVLVTSPTTVKPVTAKQTISTESPKAGTPNELVNVPSSKATGAQNTSGSVPTPVLVAQISSIATTKVAGAQNSSGDVPTPVVKVSPTTTIQANIKLST